MMIMCSPYPVHHGIFNKPHGVVCINSPVEEEQLRTDFFNLVRKEDLLKDHQCLNKKDRPFLFEWPGF